MLDNQIVVAAVAGVPTMLTVLIGILINNGRLNDMNGRLTDMGGRFGDINSRLNEMSSRIGELRSHMDARFNDVDRRINDVDRNMDQRFDDMKETWRSELHRVEEVLDARLKHLEEH